MVLNNGFVYILFMRSLEGQLLALGKLRIENNAERCRKIMEEFLNLSKLNTTAQKTEICAFYTMFRK